MSAYFSSSPCGKARRGVGGGRQGDVGSAEAVGRDPATGRPHGHSGRCECHLLPARPRAESDRPPRRRVRRDAWSSTRCSHHSEVAPTTAATRAGRRSRGPALGRRTASTPATPARPTTMRRPGVWRRAAMIPRARPAGARTTSTEPTRIGLVGRAELADRPFLHRCRRQVDDRRADREDGGGGRNGQRGDEVRGRESDHGGQHAVGGVPERAAAGSLSAIRAVFGARRRSDGWSGRMSRHDR